jgi:hypothetical protein
MELGLALLIEPFHFMALVTRKACAFLIEAIHKVWEVVASFRSGTVVVDR